MVRATIAESQRLPEPRSPRGRAGAIPSAGQLAELIVGSVGWQTADTLRAVLGHAIPALSRGHQPSEIEMVEGLILDPWTARRRGHGIRKPNSERFVSLTRRPAIKMSSARSYASS